ncbi:hypothetical protein J437_LFUL003894 [Ladona fulva]|uniref:Carboxylic ester hydrolase n=1 Tax=Ladona fulva TaxID=123851 RepID=A0A8K0K4W7_LADFU|nr:hypothetical protein J437_LFUL003894 [Ladona fulva]
MPLSSLTSLFAMENNERSPVVTIEQGSLVGITKTTLRGRNISAYLGIPYGKPPVGALRFSDPQPAESWNGVRDATKEGNACPSKHMIFRNFIGEEDCLFLNVFTPATETQGQHLKGKNAVMVWIHGGGFAMGSSEVAMYGPNFLLDRDIVLVTINYRLGPLGFLSTGDEVCSGNWGLKDQMLALKWVQQNIHAFGGDPNRVTIFGESAGGASVHYQVLSPLSKGLFHRAIAQSGSSLNPWAFRPRKSAKDLAFQLGKTLGFKGSHDSKQLLEFLRQIDPKELVLASEKLCPTHEKLAGITFAFVPTSEAEGPNAFLPGEPLELTTSGKFNKDVTFISGVTTAEGFVVEFGDNALKQNPAFLEKIDANVEILVPPILGLEQGSAKSKEAGMKIKKFFFGEQPVSPESIANYYDSQNDLLFLLGVDLTIRMQAMYSTLPVFYYQFSFEGELGMGKKVCGVDLPGVCHGDELGYLFQMEMLSQMKLSPEIPERKVIDQLVTLWANIAETGHPSQGGKRDQSASISWDPVPGGEQKVKFLDINERLQMVCNRGPQASRMNFWDSLFKEYAGEKNYFAIKLKEKL